ncbi:hypothetical protein CORT_0H00280 [Candida orthopsilosis Co 90-125]|uniref:Carboxypeptidase n=1 Tax=Candida orthopsilosis (strain 90-125) TaxID=1136231 RepID=H8XBF8_CANO9|nr:hypothetical protein CORT_0H00280 [Candida orthopsilosis Co 90-125]CCG25146.1 hypothetical protein CORT_0H00280 [Candida orthopsilosis Co 90-125]
MLYLSFYVIFILAGSVFAAPPKGGSDALKQFMVTHLPGLSKIDDGFKPLMYAGQLELFPENNTNYFFWKFTDGNKNANSTSYKRTTFWLNGGPGCSSMDGALLESGPFRIDQSQNVVSNNGSWHKVSDVIYVDQPAGTGFSYTEQGKYIHELYDMAFYFIKFMEKYYELYPEELDNDIYLAGESYAGQYIPYIAKAMLERNSNLQEGQKEYKLKGLLIGNGWVSPNEQSLAYMPFFLKRDLIKKDNPMFMKLLEQQERCQRIVDKVDAHFDDKEVNPVEVDSSECEEILTKLLLATQDGSAAHDQQCINMYDYTLRDSYPSCGMNWPYELKYVKPFLNNDDNKHDLNLKKLKTWNECSGRVSRNFYARDSFPSVHLLPDLLKQIPIVLFNGANDIICNTEGVLSYISKMKWNGIKGFENTDAKSDWVHDKKNVGYMLQERNLTFINIYNSSHMVPYDLPDVSRALLDIITGNFDEKKIDEKPTVVTYPLGVKRQGDVSHNDAEETPSKTPTSTSSTSSSTTTDSIPKASSTSTLNNEPTSHKVTRLIQLAVVIIVIWGLYLLYASYRARPASIIKKPVASGRKKNVQWADQLPDEEHDQQEGFIAKTFGKLTGNNGGYFRANREDYVDDIELGENVGDSQLDDFIIASDDEGRDDRVKSENEDERSRTKGGSGSV